MGEAEQGLQHVMSNIARNMDVKKEDRASKVLQLSRTEAGRQLLVDYGAVALLPSALKSISQSCTLDVQQPQHWDALIWTLQFTRNLCAAGDAACVSLMQAGVLDTVFDLIDKLQAADKGHLQMQKLLLQLLVNMAASSSSCSKQIWSQSFPDRLAAFAETSQEETAGPLCTLLLLITKSSNTCAHGLCTQSPPVLSPLLQYISRASEPTAAAGTLGLLIHHVIFQQGLLQAAMTLLALQQGTVKSQSRTQQPLCGQQFVLLQLLAAELEEPAGSSSQLAPSKVDDSIQFLLSWVHAMSACLKMQNPHEGLASPNLEAGLQVHWLATFGACSSKPAMFRCTQPGLPSCTQVLRALTSLEDNTPQPVRLADDQLIRMLVCSLAMLAALNPIQPPRRRTDTPQPTSTQVHQERNMLSSQLHKPDENQTQETSAMQGQPEHQHQPGQEDQQETDACCPVQQDMHQQTAHTPEELAELAEQYPKQSPYSGYRCDLVALVANLCFRRLAVQQKVQQLGGVELILSQCQWDDENPLVREYGLWAVRNLCEGNEFIQESIGSLRACSTVDSPDLQQMGMQLELDGTTGKPKMVSRTT